MISFRGGVAVVVRGLCGQASLAHSPERIEFLLGCGSILLKVYLF
jgi:hypothetical protein